MILPGNMVFYETYTNLPVTLFSLKINSIVSCLLPDIKSSLYVDDLLRKLQQSLNILGRWCDENGFKFSPTKTMCVHFVNFRNSI